MIKKRITTAQETIDAFKGIYKELYAACLLICGNENSAQAALIDVMITKQAKMNRRRAFQLAKDCALKYSSNTDAALDCLENVEKAPELANEQPWARRAVMLICACNLSLREASGIVGVKTSAIRSALARALACVSASDDAVKRRGLTAICQTELKHFAYAPDLTVLRRALENRMARDAEKSEMTSGSRLLLSNFIAVLMLLLIGFVLWAGMVMLNYFRDTAQNNVQEQSTALEEKDASLFGTD